MNWDVLTKLSPLEIQVHWVTAVIAFFLGLMIFSQKKGTLFHKTIGWVYVILMLTTAAAAFFIRSYPEGGMPSIGGFTPIHLFIPLTVFGIGGALIAIRKGNVKSHRSAMIGTFLGALIIAGLFTFIPGRRMHAFFFADSEKVERAVDRLERKE